VDDKRVVKTSKYLARHLRHDPDRLGLTIEPGGWVLVEELLRACTERSFELTLQDLREVVDRNDKRRFSFNADETKIRANQGHSITVDLALTPTAPPPTLFHGTASSALDSILRNGLHRAGRHHVHLSSDSDTAMHVGARHGRPLVLEVSSGRMAADGHCFFLTENGVWLTEGVAVQYLLPRWDLEH